MCASVGDIHDRYIGGSFTGILFGIDEISIFNAGMNEAMTFQSRNELCSTILVEKWRDELFGG